MQEMSTVIAAGIFIQNKLNIKPEYLDQIKNDAGTIVENVDFENSPAEATNTINKWVMYVLKVVYDPIIHDEHITRKNFKKLYFVIPNFSVYNF